MSSEWCERLTAFRPNDRLSAVTRSHRLLAGGAVHYDLGMNYRGNLDLVLTKGDSLIYYKKMLLKISDEYKIQFPIKWITYYDM